MLTRGTENRYGELHQPGYEHSFGRTAPLPPTFAPRHFQRCVRSQRGRKSNSVLSDAATRPSPAPPPPEPRSRSAAIRASGPRSAPDPAPRRPEGRSPRVAGPGRTAPSWGDSGRDKAATGTAGPARYVAAGASRGRTAGPRDGELAELRQPVPKERGPDAAGKPAAGPESAARGGPTGARKPRRQETRASSPRVPGRGSPVTRPGASPAVTCAAGSRCPRSGVRGPATAAKAPGSGAGCVDGGGWARGLGRPLRAVKRRTDGAARPAAEAAGGKERHDRDERSPDPGWAPALAAAAAPRNGARRVSLLAGSAHGTGAPSTRRRGSRETQSPAPRQPPLARQCGRKPALKRSRDSVRAARPPSLPLCALARVRAPAAGGQR